MLRPAPEDPPPPWGWMGTWIWCPHWWAPHNPSGPATGKPTCNRVRPLLGKALALRVRGGWRTAVLGLAVGTLLAGAGCFGCHEAPVLHRQRPDKLHLHLGTHPEHLMQSLGAPGKGLQKKLLYQLEEGGTVSHRWARRGTGASGGQEQPSWGGSAPLLVSAFLQLPAWSDAVP